MTMTDKMSEQPASESAIAPADNVAPAPTTSESACAFTEAAETQSRIERKQCVCRRVGRWVGGAIVILSFLASLAAYVCYERDQLHVRQVARRATVNTDSVSGQVIALVKSVQSVPGSRQNDQYFVLRSGRATPAQVLSGGGDCADRSRLLCSLLHQVGIPSTMAMCFDPDKGNPTHTLVEARIGPDEYMIVDPTYGLWFPKPDGEAFFDLLDLRRDPSIVSQRVDELSRMRPVADVSAQYYLRSYNGYNDISTFNWNRNTVTRGANRLLISIVGETVDRWPRPRFIEEPQLAVATLAGMPGAAVLLLATLLTVKRWRATRRTP